MRSPSLNRHLWRAYFIINTGLGWYYKQWSLFLKKLKAECLAGPYANWDDLVTWRHGITVAHTEHPIFDSTRLCLAGCGLLLALSATNGASTLQDPPTVPVQAPEGQQIRLRAPWVDRARDLGVFPPDGIAVFTDGPRLEATGLMGRVVAVRSITTTLFGSFGLRRPDAPKLLVFEDLGEMRFTLRTSFGTKASKVTALAVQQADGTALAVSTQVDSPSVSERVFQAQAFRQYVLPRFPVDFSPWAEIGLSEFLGAVLITDDSWDAGHVPPEFATALQQAEQSGQRISLEALIRLDPKKLARNDQGQDTRLLHAEAWSLVHFLLTGGSPELADRFVHWLHKVASGQEPVLAFKSVFTQMPGGASMDALESAWRASTRNLVPSPVLRALQEAELLRLVLDELEEDGIRPDAPDDLLTIVEARPAIEHTLLSHPYEQVLSSRDPGIIDPARLEFSPNPVRPSIRNTATSECPPLVRFLDSGDWVVQIEWSWDEAEERWLPRVIAKAP